MKTIQQIIIDSSEEQSMSVESKTKFAKIIDEVINSYESIRVMSSITFIENDLYAIELKTRAIGIKFKNSNNLLDFAIDEEELYQLKTFIKENAFIELL